MAYASTSAPVVFVDLPAAAVAGVARRDDVVSLGLEGAWSPSMATARRAVDANWTTGSGDGGNGVRVAVVEYHNVRRGGDMTGKVVKSHSTTGRLAFTGGGTFDHPTWVAGAIAGQNRSWKGVAPGASIVSAGTGGYSASLAYDRRIIAAADWAIAPGGGNADIVNTSLVQDTATGAEEGRRYFDSLVDQDGRLAISAAGNYVNFGGWQIGSPGTGYNVLTVGGVNDRGTAKRADDRIWYVPGSNGSNWFDRPGDAVESRTATTTSRTWWRRRSGCARPTGSPPAGPRVATPIVAGVAAQLLANEPVLAAWPEGARAVLMAGAIHRVRMPNGSRNVDHEGVGMTSAVLDQPHRQAGRPRVRRLRHRLAVAGPGAGAAVNVRGGDRLRVALAWNSHTGGARQPVEDRCAARRPRPAGDRSQRRGGRVLHHRQRLRVRGDDHALLRHGDHRDPPVALRRSVGDVRPGMGQGAGHDGAQAGQPVARRRRAVGEAVGEGLGRSSANRCAMSADPRSRSPGSRTAIASMPR